MIPHGVDVKNLRQIFFRHESCYAIWGGCMTQTRRPIKSCIGFRGYTGEKLAVIKWTPRRAWIRWNLPTLWRLIWPRFMFGIIMLEKYPEVGRITGLTNDELSELGVHGPYYDIPMSFQISRRDRRMQAYHAHWDAIYAAQGYGYKENPEVWVINFRPL